MNYWNKFLQSKYALPVQTAIRIAFTILLLCGVYHETGLWTTTFLSLFAINSELKRS